MALSTRTEGQKQDLNERLRSLRINRDAPPPNPTRAPKKLLLAVAAVVALAAVGYAYFFSGAQPVTAGEARTEAAGATRGTVLTVSGYVVAHHKIEVGAKVMGRVAWIGVEKGDKVEKGQTLVRLEDSEFRAQVNQARANLAAATARLDQLRAGSRPQEKLKEKAAVLQAEASLREAEADYERIETLHRGGVAARAELDRATARRDTARALLQAARQSSEMTDIGPRSEEIRAAEAEAQQMRAALDYALVQLEATEIKAPVSGTILQRIVEQGEMVTPSAFGESGARTSVVSLADLQDLQIELDVSQADFARLSMGQRAEIIPEAYPNLRYTGFIAEIAPEANRAKATVQVKVKVENPDGQLRPEMNARVNFLAAEEQGAAGEASNRVVAPKAAITRRGDGDYVFVIKGGRVEQRFIRRGDETGDGVYILEGLSGGEVLVTAGAEKLSDGDRVTVQNQ